MDSFHSSVKVSTETGQLQSQVLAEAQVQISMGGWGRAFDNITIERLWRTVRYEEVFLKDYRHLFAARESLDEYFRFNND